MQTIKIGTLRGAFKGFNGQGTTYEFMDGERWRQVCETVRSHYAFMPDAQIIVKDSKYYIRLDCLKDMAEVVHVL